MDGRRPDDVRCCGGDTLESLRTSTFVDSPRPRMKWLKWAASRGLSPSSCRALYSRRALWCLHTNSPLTPLKARSGAPDGLIYPSTMALYGNREPLLPSRHLLDPQILLQPQSHFPSLVFSFRLRRSPSLSPPVFGSYDRQKDLQAELIWLCNIVAVGCALLGPKKCTLIPALCTVKHLRFILFIY